MSVTVDTSEIRQLIAQLRRAADKPIKERTRMLREVGAQVEAEARQNLAGHRDTGATEASLRTQMIGVTRVRIHSDTRGAFFLEYGSPNTGAPIPWLSEPARRGEEWLLEELGKVADPLA